MASEDIQSKSESGAELCRIKREGGLIGGYRNDILIENLSDREKQTYNCPRCGGIMKDASLSSKGEPLCLECKHEGEQPILNAQVRNIIVSLKCACPLSRRGCEWLGTLDNVESHLITCGYVYDSCQLSCGLVLTRDELSSHMPKCVQRNETCEHCKEAYKVCEMLEHVRVCGKVPLMCGQGCGSRVQRADMKVHKDSLCDQDTVISRRIVKHRSEVVGNGHLHFEMRLDALEEQNWKLSKQLEMLLSEMRVKNREIELLNEKVEILEDISIRISFPVKWTIKDVDESSNRRMSFSEEYEIAGYRFQLRYFTENRNLYIDFSFIRGTNTDLLEWPFRAYFISRMICQKNLKDSIPFKSPIIVIQKGEYRFGFLSHKRIASIPLPTDMKDFLQSNCLDLEITVNILRAK